MSDEDYSMRQYNFIFGGGCLACLLMMGLYYWEIAAPNALLEMILKPLDQVPALLIGVVGAGAGLLLEEIIYKKKTTQKVKT